MTQEDKQLLFKDLCARLQCEVKVDLFGQTKELIGVLDDIVSVGYDINDYEDAAIEDIKPYLRPMSSMTEEEKLMYEGLMIGTNNISYMLDVIDWLNANHFDYRGLISKGLALEAPKGMYND